MVVKLWSSMILFICGVIFSAIAHATFPSVPNELYEALGLDKSSTTPKELHEAVTKRYRDPAQGAGPGSHAQYWEPIPMSMYFDPMSFYETPSSPDEIAKREDCVECHTDTTPVWVAAWKKSTHANLNKIRELKPEDPRFYKKAKLEEVENNLRSMGKLGAEENLKEVSCIDCHVAINTQEEASHKDDMRMPTGEICGTCHLREFAERESERDTLIWPEGIGWPDGRPSHALDYKANVEVSVYAGMPQREIAEGCTMCHVNQTTCDHCHTRHEFSAAESRRPEACATCHSGVDHNNWEAYSMSKHGKIVAMMGNSWNWEAPLKDMYSKGGQTAPACAGCHFEFDGKYTHNITRKIRWANYPVVPGIASNITSEWAEDRKDSWVTTCTNCHSERFARSYLEFMDKGTLHLLAKYQEVNRIVKGLYDDNLLTGQTTNRPDPPPPMKAGYSQFFQLYWSKNNNPSSLELKVLEMGENDLPKGHVGLAHVNPGGWTYTDGWGPLNRAYVEIMDENTKLRHELALQKRVAKLEKKKFSLFNGETTEEKVSLGGLGGGMLLAGTIALAGWRRRAKREN